ncbi:MAG: OmpA family protein [Pseudomonadota bacterium]
MKVQNLCTGLLLSLLLLSGCAIQQQSDKALQAARVDFERIKEDPDLLRHAPKDVIRAGESLARAESLSNYWGNQADVLHYAFLSQRYGEIAREHSTLNLNQARVAKLARERARLQTGVREAKLLSVQQQGNWLQEQMLSLETIDTERGLVMTLGDVLFDAGRAELKNDANRTVLKLVQFLQLNPRRTVRIEGYTDGQGDAQENLELSRSRAQLVADVLLDLGIDEERIEVQGLGESYPMADNASRRGRAQNRRVEVVFSDAQGHLGGRR